MPDYGKDYSLPKYSSTKLSGGEKASSTKDLGSKASKGSKVKPKTGMSYPKKTSKKMGY